MFYNINRLLTLKEVTRRSTQIFGTKTFDTKTFDTKRANLFDK